MGNVAWLTAVVVLSVGLYAWSRGSLWPERRIPLSVPVAEMLWSQATPWSSVEAGASPDLVAFFEYQVQHARAMGESNWLNTLPRATEADVATIESYLLAHAVQEDLVGAQRRAMAVGLIRRAPTHTLGGPFLGDGFVIVNGSFPGVGSVIFRIEKDREPELYPPLAELAASQVKLRRLLAAR